MSTLVLDLADVVVENCTLSEMKKAVAHAEALRNGDKKKCRCKSCLYDAVNTANYWLDCAEDCLNTQVWGRYRVIVNNKGDLKVDFMKI